MIPLYPLKIKLLLKIIDAFLAWCERRYGWGFGREELVMSNGIIPALYELVEYICKPDEKVLFLTPSYTYFKYAAEFSKN